ncbi:MAG TPA: nitroreductase family deazaflavin-dependent oxidoreductase [Candidatus Limnocylindria bacterium]|nr:nitroreductase family deazaflavin-dependent oxidoreductase [Candidatus Limnocylindria bacterium]
MHDFEKALIQEMRTHDGKITSGPLAGHPLLVLTSSGARSGEPRQAILTFSRDQGDYVVAGTAGGSPSTPAWVYNLREHPEVEIEAENRTFDATARVVDAEERDRLWEQHVARLPHFAEYPVKAKRVIPMVRITPKAA